MSSKEEQTSNLAKYSWPAIAVILVIVIFGVLAFRSSNDSIDNNQQVQSPISGDIDQKHVAFLRVGLTTPDDCDAVLDYYKDNALKQVTAYGLTGNRDFFDGGITTDVLPSDIDVVADVAESTEVQSSDGTSSYSTTNIQVEGVDEADIVKNDGNYIYVLSGQILNIIEIEDTSEDNPPTIVAEMDLGFYANSMLISSKSSDVESSSDTLVIIGSEGHGQFRLVQVDIDDRESPEIMADFVVDGRYVGARIVDSEVRLVTVSQPLGFDWEYPQGSGLRAQDVALEANKAIIRNSDLNNWLPAYKNNLQENSEVNSLIDCSQILTPYVFSGLNTLSIMTFNASETLTSDSWRAIGLAAEGQGIYANTDNVYVATTVLTDESQGDTFVTQFESEADFKTIIHKFSLVGLSESESTVTRPIYVASGEVPGVLLNQFSMDEYQGDLRVALTVTNLDDNTQENHIRILQPQQGILEEIGAVTGLGIDESIFAVRFMGSQAYIVTFRQIDPLYALDLSDPTNPKALGELKITGFSSYLHPVGDNLLLGVGQEANQEGVQQGLQISLFDISDQTNPQRLSQLLLTDALLDANHPEGELEWSSSAAERDHRAFLYYEGLAFIPYYIYGAITNDDNSLYYDWDNANGILVVTIKDNTLVVDNILKAKGLDSDDKSLDSAGISIGEPERTIVVDDFVYGIDRSGKLIVWRLSDGESLHFISY